MQKKLQLFFLSGLIFTIPTNLFVKFFESTAYTNGIFIDYLIPKVYLSDVFALGLLITWFLEKKRTLSLKELPNNHKLFFLLALLLFGYQFFTPKPLAGVWYTGKLLEFSLLFLFLRSHLQLLKKPLIHWTTITALVFQSTLALYQYLAQHSLLGYAFLGEPTLSQPFGITKIVIDGVEKIAPYGTTAHPNILGGTLAIFLLVVIHNWREKKHTLQLIKLVAIGLGITALFLTMSLSAWIAFVSGIFLILAKNSLSSKVLTFYVVTVLVAVPIFVQLSLSTQTSILRRRELQELSVSVLMAKPLFGGGLNQFTVEASRVSSPELVRFSQPVHHVPLLWLAETGLTGLLVLIALVRAKSIKKYMYPLVVLAPIAALDHYFLSQQTGLLLSVFMLVYFSR